jgi:hypothetical protein
MKKIYFLFFLCCVVQYVFSQTVQRDTIDYSAGLHVPPYICEGEEIVITLNQSQYPIFTIDYYYKWRDVDSCNPNDEINDRQVDNNSLRWEGNGAIRLDSLNKNVIYFKPSASGALKISFYYSSFFAGNNCNPARSYITYCLGTSNRIIVIPKPSPPKLFTDKISLRYPESTTIISLGCPNTLLSEGYYPNTPSVTNWRWGCPQFTDPIGPGGQYWIETESINFSTGSRYYNYGVNNFYARCNDNGCISDVSKVRINVQPSIVADEIVANIDAINAATNRADYHYYETSKDICVVGSTPNCTQQKVFDLLLSSKANQGPIAADFTGLGGPDKRVNLLGSRLIYGSDSSPIEDGDEVYLPDPRSVALGAAALTRGIPGIAFRHLFLSSSSQNKLVSSPIRILVDRSTYTATNYTLPYHPLYPGKVIRTVVEECGIIRVITMGVGQSWLGDNVLGKAAGYINRYSGQSLFKSVDDRLKVAYDNLPN